MIDAPGQIERLIDLRVRIDGQEKRSNQEIERTSRHRQASDLDAFEGHRRLTVGGLKSRHHANALFSLNQLGYQPIGLDAGALPHSEEVHERGSGRSIGAEFEPGLPHAMRNDGRDLHARPCIQLGFGEDVDSAGLGFVALNDVELPGNLGCRALGRSRD